MGTGVEAAVSARYVSGSQCAAIGFMRRAIACMPSGVAFTRRARCARDELLGGLRVALAHWRQRYAALRSADARFRPPDVQVAPAHLSFEAADASTKSADASSDARSATFATADASVD